MDLVNIILLLKDYIKDFLKMGKNVVLENGRKQLENLLIVTSDFFLMIQKRALEFLDGIQGIIISANMKTMKGRE